jgi:glyoxylase-like metal-dependent hydrolase (beta-lactamase superfamily II)
METVTAPNGAVTTATQLQANALWGLTETTVAEKVTDGVYALRGWGIASSYAIEAPDGWIIIDTGDSTRAAAEMRALLEQTLGRKIKVAAILLTHWHYADGTGAWLDEGTEVWGHEFLDRNRSASTGVSVKSGFYQARAIAQFAVFHPPQGPDAFPSLMRFFPEKLLAVSSYQPPTRLFENGRVLDVVVAGEPAQVAPNRTDTSDSVAFYFPRHRLVVTNFMVTGAIFNIYTLRGGPFRDPANFINDARWVESKNAEILLDIHGPTLKGEKTVFEAIERSVDQVQLIHDQTLRLIAHGMDAREAAEALYMPRHLREGREAYGQVESHVRQIWNGTVGWFGGDVYEINPLSLREEAARTIDMMGGPAAVRNTARKAADSGGLAGREPAIRPLPRGSAQGRRQAVGVHHRGRGRPADQAGRVAQQRARDHHCQRQSRDALGRIAERAGGFRTRQGGAGECRWRIAGRAGWGAGSKPADAPDCDEAGGAR